MKLHLLCACTLASALLFTGCDKKINDPVPTPNPINSEPKPANGMTAKVDGIDWVATNPSATTQGGFQLGGVNSNDLSISFYCSNISATGTFTGTAMMHLPIPGTASADSWGDPAAKLVVTKFDKTTKLMSGTFQFTANPNPGSSGTKIVTNGVFTNIPIL